jgi:hypothetical protein
LIRPSYRLGDPAVRHFHQLLDTAHLNDPQR